MTPEQIDQLAIEEFKREMGASWMESSWEVASGWVQDRLRIAALTRLLVNAEECSESLRESVLRTTALLASQRDEASADVERWREHSETWQSHAATWKGEYDAAVAKSSDLGFKAELVGDKPLRREGFRLACDAFEDAVQSAAREYDGATWVRTDTVRKALAVAARHGIHETNIL